MSHFYLQKSWKSQREEKMIVNLINEVRDQSNLRIQQQQKLGEQEEKLRNLQSKIENLDSENLNLKDQMKRYKDELVSLKMKRSKYKYNILTSTHLQCWANPSCAEP